jgi:AhpD family alkylhydroperoxidase
LSDSFQIVINIAEKAICVYTFHGVTVWQAHKSETPNVRRAEMAVLPYADLHRTDARDLVDKIIAERGSVLHLYQMLLHSPPIAEGWLALLTAVRQKASLPGGLRELVIMRVAALNGAPYEAQQHAPIALAEGVSSEQLEHLAEWRSSDVFDALQRAVLALTDGMTRDVKVPHVLIDEVRQYLSDREVVELVTTIAAYNMVSRFLEALGIDSNDAR